jgi:hypothetical protein
MAETQRVLQPDFVKASWRIRIMGNTMPFVEILFGWYGFSDVQEGLRDDNASRSPWSHKAMLGRLELDRDLSEKPAAA